MAVRRVHIMVDDARMRTLGERHVVRKVFPWTRIRYKVTCTCICSDSCDSSYLVHVKIVT